MKDVNSIIYWERNDVRLIYVVLMWFQVNELIPDVFFVTFPTSFDHSVRTIFPCIATQIQFGRGSPILGILAYERMDIVLVRRYGNEKLPGTNKSCNLRYGFRHEKPARGIIIRFAQPSTRPLVSRYN